MAGEILIMIPQYGELNRIYSDFIVSHTFSFDKQKFITNFYKQYNDTKVFEAAILELVLDKQKEQYTLILDSLRAEIEKNMMLYEKYPLLDDEIISRVCYHFADRYNIDIEEQLEVTQRLNKPLNEAYNRYDSIGYREHTAEEEKQAEKEYERCKAEYEKEKEELKKKGEDSQLGSFTAFPDLILMDGGRGQVNIALQVLDELHLNIAVCGMVKDDHHRTRGLYYNNIEIPIDRDSEAFRLITRIQDEAHRFAIEYHRQLRGKGQVHSVLDDIPGIGSARRKALMRHFLSLDAIRDASVEELAKIPSMNQKAAESVYEFLH